MTEKTAPPSKTADQFVVRLPPGMRDKIAELAEAGGRSMNSEIVRRLEWAMKLVGEPVTTKNMPLVSGDIPYGMAQDIALLASEANVSFDQMLARIFVAGIHPSASQVIYMPVLPGASGKDVSTTLKAMKEFIRPDATIMSEMVTRWSALTDLARHTTKTMAAEVDVINAKPVPPKRTRKPAKN